MKVRSILTLVLPLLLSSCAQMNHTRQSTPPPVVKQPEVVSFNSTPSGATAKLSTGESCTTPCKLRKNVDSSFRVTFSKEGYGSKSVTVGNNLEALKKYNRARGMKVDDFRVENMKLVPNPVTVTLEPEWSK